MGFLFAFYFYAMRLNAIILLCLYYNSKHSCKFSCLCLFALSFRLLSLLCLFCLCSALLFVFVCYAIKCAPCSVNAERQKQHHGERIAERRQGERLRRACPALPDCRCYRCIIYHYARTYAAGVYRPAPGGTFSVRFGEGKEPNRSCSSPRPLVLTFQQYWRINPTLLFS